MVKKVQPTDQDIADLQEKVGTKFYFLATKHLKCQCLLYVLV